MEYGEQRHVLVASSCRYCNQKAGIFRCSHPDCEEIRQVGWKEMGSLVNQAATARTFNEAALRQSLAAIANRSHATSEDIERALEEGGYVCLQGIGICENDWAVYGWRPAELSEQPCGDVGGSCSGAAVGLR